MARQTLLSFLGAGKVKKEEKVQEKEPKVKEYDSAKEYVSAKEYDSDTESSSNKKDSLNMVDVEEDIFCDIPQREKRGEENPDSDFFNGWWNSEKPEMEPEEEGWGFQRPESDLEAEKPKADVFSMIDDSGKDDFFQDIIEPEYEVEKAKSIYFEIVLDKTISMAKVYKPIYKKLEKMIDNMDRAVKNYQKKGQVGLKWGLTLITEEEPEPVRFQESYFTASPDRIKMALKEFQFEGGSGNGRENINEALTAAIKMLSQESQGEGRCGLILLTDSLPEEDDTEPDFEYLENVEHTELCFAHCFVYNCEAYTPYFNMVDGEGETDVKGIHYLEIRDLDAFLNREADNLTEKLLKKLLHQTSISV